MSKWKKLNLIISNLVFVSILILMANMFYDWFYQNYLRESYRPVQLAEEKTLKEASEKNIRIQWISIDGSIKFNQGINVAVFPIGVSREVKVEDGNSYALSMMSRSDEEYGVYGKSYYFSNLVNLALQYPEESDPWILFDCRVKVARLSSLTINDPSLMLLIERADNCNDRSIKENSLISVNLKSKSFKVYMPPAVEIEDFNLNTKQTYVEVAKSKGVEFPLLKRSNKLIYNISSVAHSVGEGKKRKKVTVARPYELDLVTGEWHELLPSETIDKLQQILDGRPATQK